MSMIDEGYAEPVPYRLPAGSLAGSVGRNGRLADLGWESARPAVPRARRAGRWRAWAGRAVVRLGGVLAPHRAALARLRDMPLTVAGAVCVDFAAFHYVHAIGWLITGVSLMLIERMIADED